jgi:hypothetical protein
VRNGPESVHIVTYQCEHCRATHTRAVGDHHDGMCRQCGFPMRIDDLFSDRRIVTVPVLAERRDECTHEAA